MIRLLLACGSRALPECVSVRKVKTKELVQYYDHYVKGIKKVRSIVHLQI